MAKDILKLDPTDTVGNVKYMVSLVPTWSKQKEAIKAGSLVRGADKTIAMSLWLYFRKNFAYKADPKGVELVRSPNQSYKDRNHGIDCEDFAVFISCVLYNNRILHSFRIVDYGDGWEHIYIVMKDKYIIDPVNPKFNKEFSEVKRKKDFNVKNR